jgi:mono/diheme cytochrome c family protein
VRKRQLIFTLMAVMLLGTHGLGKKRTKGWGSFLYEIEKAPLSERQRQNPYEGQPQAIAAGQKLFRQHCAQCHGEEGHGTDRAPDLHSPSIREATPGELAWFLKNGNLRTGMPSWSRLPEQRRWQIIAFLKSLQ